MVQLRLRPGVLLPLYCCFIAERNGGARSTHCNIGCGSIVWP
jgi:hypothetical protein